MAGIDTCKQLNTIAFLMALIGFLWAADTCADVTTTPTTGTGPFTAQGKLIPPECVSELTGEEGFIRSIDIEKCMTNKNIDKEFSVDRQRDGVTLRTVEMAPGSGWFAYSYLGHTENGVDVLSTVENEGGTGEFESVLLVRLKTERGIAYFGDDGTKHESDKLVLQKIGEISRGDRDNGDVVVDGNCVILTQSRYRQKAISYCLD